MLLNNASSIVAGVLKPSLIPTPSSSKLANKWQNAATHLGKEDLVQALLGYRGQFLNLIQHWNTSSQLMPTGGFNKVCPGD